MWKNIQINSEKETSEEHTVSNAMVPRCYIIFRSYEDQWCTAITIKFGLQTGNHSECSSGQNWSTLKNKTEPTTVKEVAYSLRISYEKVPQLLSSTNYVPFFRKNRNTECFHYPTASRVEDERFITLQFLNPPAQASKGKSGILVSQW